MINPILKLKHIKKISPGFALVLCIFIAQFIYAYAFFIEPSWIMIKKVRIKSPKLAMALKGLRIVQISDLHIANIGFREMSLIDKVNNLKPDILLITGDFVDTKEGINASWDTLRLFEVKHAIYAIYGDMDDLHIAELIDDPQWKKSGVTMLNDRAARLSPTNEAGRNFWVVGVHKAEDIGALIAEKSPYEPVIMMTPDPDYVDEAANLNVDLVVTGDTHGGQINPRFLRSVFPIAIENRSPYVWGLFKIRNTLLYVNRGIGTSHINVRFLCWPEITVFEFAALE
ncbi:MAG: metallophosphoesterase [Candidatus Omnitrophica bacterium]|nr:metallophosphoesterase [Candidatus Omnitrophota bacterium]